VADSKRLTPRIRQGTKAVAQGRRSEERIRERRAFEWALRVQKRDPKMNGPRFTALPLLAAFCNPAARKLNALRVLRNPRKAIAL